jgi:hypothetical protein
LCGRANGASAEAEKTRRPKWLNPRQTGATVKQSMKKAFEVGGAVFALTFLLTVCQSLAAHEEPKKAADMGTRNNAYSLLHQLLGEQKDVSLLRLIKREDVDLKELTKKIAKTSGIGEQLLEELGRKDPTIKLEEIDLPSGELATRDAIAATKKKELLTQKRDEFELTLLLSQTEALSYASHLAEVARDNETQPEARDALEGISIDMQRLYQEVFQMILAKERNPSSAAEAVK